MAFRPDSYQTHEVLVVSAVSKTDGKEGVSRPASDTIYGWPCGRIIVNQPWSFLWCFPKQAVDMPQIDADEVWDDLDDERTSWTF
jgi:hypothetical protein